jgi:hypothetical protein
VAIGQYILDDDGNPRLEPDVLKWAMWYEYSHLSPGKDNRILGKDYIGDAHVSTIFLGLDYSHRRNPERPILWETMIFGGEHDQYMQRYDSKDAALAGHAIAVKMVQESQADLRELERMAEAGGWTKK